jgi:hypothetical protein
MIGMQTARLELTRLNILLHEIADAGGRVEDGIGEVAAERRIGQFTKRIGRLLQILPAETFRNYLRTDDYRTIWEELNSSADHRE